MGQLTLEYFIFQNVGRVLSSVLAYFICRAIKKFFKKHQKDTIEEE